MGTTMYLDFETPAQEDRLAFLALPAKRASEQVAGTTNDIFVAVQTILDRMLSDVCGKRTAEEFCAARELYLPQYMRVMTALGNLVQTVVPVPVINQLCYESMSEMEADFRDEGRANFGQDIADQAMFTVWTLRKINDLVDQVSASDGPREGLKDSDAKLKKQFVNYILYTRFHLDCLKMSMRSGRAIYPDVLEQVSEGLRALVNAYSYIRQASDLHFEVSDEEPISIDFDDEEQELVALSMKDLVADANF
jgi:hypothetical protein